MERVQTLSEIVKVETVQTLSEIVKMERVQTRSEIVKVETVQTQSESLGEIKTEWGREGGRGCGDEKERQQGLCEKLGTGVKTSIFRQ